MGRLKTTKNLERRSIWGSKIEATSLKGKGGQNGYSRDVKHVEPG